jgi:hypothetical protein
MSATVNGRHRLATAVATPAPKPLIDDLVRRVAALERAAEQAARVATLDSPAHEQAARAVALESAADDAAALDEEAGDLGDRVCDVDMLRWAGALGI